MVFLPVCTLATAITQPCECYASHRASDARVFSMQQTPDSNDAMQMTGLPHSFEAAWRLAQGGHARGVCAPGPGAARERQAPAARRHGPGPPLAPHRRHGAQRRRCLALGTSHATQALTQRANSCPVACQAALVVFTSRSCTHDLPRHALFRRNACPSGRLAISYKGCFWPVAHQGLCMLPCLSSRRNKTFFDLFGGTP